MKTGIEVDVAVALDREPSPEVAAMLYRCTRECLANISKHSHARHAAVQVAADSAHVRLRVQDDGIGLPPGGIDQGAAEGHIGLQLLRDAAADLGGTMAIFSAPAGGTVVELDLPAARADLADRSRRHP
jgi:signal transduction histidine kinase